MDDKKRTRGGVRSGTMSASPLTKMRKSCDACAVAKRKCDGKATCSLCSKRGSLCIYSERQKSGPKKAGSRSDETAAHPSPAKPKVFPPAQFRSPEFGPGGSNNLPQEKGDAQRNSTRNWLLASALPCPKANVAAVNPPSKNAGLTPAVARHTPKKAKKITAGRERAQLQEPRTHQDIAGAVSMCSSAVSSATIAAKDLQASYARPIQMATSSTEPAVEALTTHATCTTHPPTQADSEAEQLRVSLLPMLRRSESVPTDANSQVAFDVRRMPDMPTPGAKHVVRLESSTDESSSGWEDLPEMLLPTLEDEILWSCHEISDDDSASGMGTRTTLGASENSSFVVPISQDFKSLAIGGGGGLGFRPTSQERPTPGLPAGSVAHVTGTNPAICGGSFVGGVSPISSWTQEAVEAGASTLLAVLAGGDTGAPLGGREGGIRLGAGVTGAGSEIRPDSRLAWTTNFSGTGVPTYPSSLALQDPRYPSYMQPTALQHYSTASHVAQHTQHSGMLEPVQYEGPPRNWAISKPNLASF
ncbi:unnamed protein product [Ascophyllum nodosum]